MCYYKVDPLLQNSVILQNRLSIFYSQNEDFLLKRITKRALESKITRDDDNSEILKNRIVVYKKDTLPVLEYYKNLKKLHSINGMQNIEDVSKDIQKVLT